MRVLALALVALVALAPTSALAIEHASLPDIENQVMCVTCGIPLAEAQSPQADRERAYISSLIAQGETTNQIKRSLVGQFGPAVLAMPNSHGFNLAAYLVPIVVVALVVIALLIALPRWRRRSTAPATSAPALRPEDAARLDADLARFE
jgi:cytochrome c-type biogenesis protein CcmH